MNVMDYQRYALLAKTLREKLIISETALLEAQLDAQAWREEAFKCYVASGADPSDMDARHLQFGEASEAVQELNADYKTACLELHGGIADRRSG